jgi:hypothetical protein
MTAEYSRQWTGAAFWAYLKNIMPEDFGISVELKTRIRKARLLSDG